MNQMSRIKIRFFTTISKGPRIPDFYTESGRSKTYNPEPLLPDYFE